MRIAFFVGGFPVLSETFIIRQITGLIDAGHAVDVFAEGRPPRDQAMHAVVRDYRLRERTTYLDLPLVPWRPLYAAPWLLGSLARAPRAPLSVLRGDARRQAGPKLSALYRLYRLTAERRRYDVAHAHFGPVANNAACVRTLWNVPLVATFHGYDFSVWPRTHGPGAYRTLFEAADLVTVNSGHSGRRVAALGCPPAKLRKLPMGLDPRAIPFRERTLLPGEPVRLVTVARLVEKKGVAYAIRAVAALTGRYPRLRYDIVGAGPLRAELGRLIADLGVSDVVTLHGAKPEHDVRRLLERAHLFALTSVTAADGDQEGQGLVLQEAQAAGLPVVATEHNGFPESLLPGESGLLVPERDVPALARALADLLDHPERWPAMGRAGRRYVEDRFDIRGLTDQLAGLYAEAIARYHTPKERCRHA